MCNIYTLMQHMNRSILIGILSLAGVLTGEAQEFFSTERRDELFTLGVRAGVNTSNRTVASDCGFDYQYQSWGTGFSAGLVADINIRDYVAIQPGVFFESCSGHSTFTSVVPNLVDRDAYVAQSAHRHTYNLNIPVLASFRFNVTDAIRWQIEAGPYVAFLLKSKLQNKELIASRPELENEVPFKGKPASVDFGLKIGTGLEFMSHYYVGVHYEAGLTRAYKNKDLGNNLIRTYGGHTKAWTFTLGYNF